MSWTRLHKHVGIALLILATSAFLVHAIGSRDDQPLVQVGTVRLGMQQVELSQKLGSADRKETVNGIQRYEYAGGHLLIDVDSSGLVTGVTGEVLQIDGEALGSELSPQELLAALGPPSRLDTSSDGQVVMTYPEVDLAVIRFSETRRLLFRLGNE